MRNCRDCNNHVEIKQIDDTKREKCCCKSVFKNDREKYHIMCCENLNNRIENDCPFFELRQI